MTDLTPGDRGDLRRWPSIPAHLISPSLCPACFSALGSSTCTTCGLDLAVPAAAELFALGQRIHTAEASRQSLITSMRAAQAARAADAAARVALPVAAMGVAPAAMRIGEPVVAAAGSADAVAPVATVPAPAHPVTAPPVAPAAPSPSMAVAQAPAATTLPKRSGRSGVQVLLLTLGVVLISITAIVFLFVAYLVASLEVRSIIIAAASVLVLGVAWLLRARGLPGTAEGVASVAIVLLLLDVWIVRANGLFGTDALSAGGYTGGALLVVAAALLGVRAASGIRVAGFAAAGLAPIGVFLLVAEASPDSSSVTAWWLGSLAVAVLGAAAVLLPRSIERTIMMAAGVGGGVIALITAVWALPDASWHQLFAYLAVTAAWLAMLLAVRLRAGVSPVWGRVAAPMLGLAVALAPTVSIATELDASLALWLAPAAAGLVACLFAAGTHLRGTWADDAAWACLVAVVVAFAAAVPAAVLGIGVVMTRLATTVPPWNRALDEPLDAITRDSDLGVVLVPFVVAVGALAVTALVRRARTFAAIPIGAALAGVLVVGALAPNLAVTSFLPAIAAGGALALAVALRRFALPAVTVTLLVLGVTGAAIAWCVGYSSTALWPWVVVLVIALAVAGRALSRRVWADSARSAIGAAHLAIAAVLAIVAVASVPFWFRASAAQLADAWMSPWMWVATTTAALLVAAAIIRRGSTGDRLAVILPLFAASVIAIFALAFEAEPALRWLPALVLVVAGVLWLRMGVPASLRIPFAGVTPLAIAFTSAVAVELIFGREFIAIGLAGATLLAAALAHLLPMRGGTARPVWAGAVGVAGVVSLAAAASGLATTNTTWLVLLVLTPVPIVLAALDGDPIASHRPGRHLAWLSLALAVATVWTRLASDGVDNVEAYTLPLAAALAVTAGLITWRRLNATPRGTGRTALFATAAAIAVLPSVASAAESELRTLLLASIGIVVAIAAMFLPETARAVPVRLLGAVAGWVAVTGAGLVRGTAIALDQGDSVLIVEFWPFVALATGVALAVMWTRTASKPGWLAEALLTVSVVVAVIPTLLAIVLGEDAALRAAVLFPLLAVAHIGSAITTARPFAGPQLGWSTLGALGLGGVIALASRTVDPFDLVTAPVAVALIGAGWFRMRRSPSLGSWPALGPGLAVLLLPALLADFTDPQVWRLVALGVVTVVVVVVGAMRRLQAPLLLGGAVLLVHAIVQLWPWITDLYEAVWWWLWLGIAGVLLVVLAATYERQLRLARGTIRSIAELR
ncbi:SCO7613 C-terminal domain-containing membrane protein [Agromyces subbeticus]|uniref:SCO7613 C-terminal domain-containing membrane protein n=1 Tax=Agromyces subbeticus TaxID=293890 RepID=UPI0012EB9621|nr:hypothetical protein [Agromyces subbeticus]